MEWLPLHPSWRELDVDVAALWSDSGAAWLTVSGVEVPARMVRSLVGIVEMLDSRGASLAEISTARGVGLLAERAAALGLMPSSGVSCGGASQLLRGIDGWLAVTLARNADIEMVPAWLESGPNSLAPDELWDVVAQTVANGDTADLEERATLLGMPVSRVCSTEGRNHPGGVLTKSLGYAAPTALDGLVVLNLASLWAGPLCADVLARLGARVITVESENRPDGARRTARFFESLHGRSESVVLPLHDDAGRRILRDLISNADVLIEGSRPRALEQMGVDFSKAMRSGPRLWVSITAYGRDLPQGNRIGFGDDAAAAGGLVGWIGENPNFLADAVADPLSGLVAAASVVDLLERGGRHLIDVSMSHVAYSMLDSGGTASGARGEMLRPRMRTDLGGPMPLGRDNRSVMAGFGIR
jgi:hypothetical protein